MRKDIEKRHINYECVPVVVDLEQGWRLSHLTSAAIQKLIQQGVNIVHIEDQDLDKRCGHLGGKILASLDGWGEILQTAYGTAEIELGKDVLDKGYFQICARTDALSATAIASHIEKNDEWHPDHKFIDFDKGKDKITG